MILFTFDVYVCGLKCFVLGSRMWNSFLFFFFFNVSFQLLMGGVCLSGFKILVFVRRLFWTV